MSGTRRRFFQDAAIFGAGLLGLSESIEAQAEKPMQMRPREAKHAHTPPAGTPLPMMMPDLADLLHEMAGVRLGESTVERTAEGAGHRWRKLGKQAGRSGRRWSGRGTRTIRGGAVPTSNSTPPAWGVPADASGSAAQHERWTLTPPARD